MSFRTPLFFLSILVYLVAFGPAKAAVLGSFPFEYHQGYLWVKVTARGSATPLHFLLDSGAATSILNIDTARRLGTAMGKAEQVQGVGTTSAARRVKGFEANASGSALPSSLLALDFKSFGIVSDRRVDGLLGADFFRGRIVQIDFASHKVLLLDQIARGPNTEVLPIKTCNSCWLAPLQIAGYPMQWMRVDTGCDSALEWFASGNKRKVNHETSVALTGASVEYTPTEVKIGSTQLRAVPTGIHHSQIFPGESGLFGNPLLSKFKVTLDAQHNLLFLERIPAVRIPHSRL